MAHLALPIGLAHVTLPGLVAGLSTAIDMIQPELAGHQKRTGVVAATLARAMDLPKDTAATAAMCGLVHDVGQLAYKECAWAPDEELGDEAAAVGGRFLTISRLTRTLAKPVAHHHMDWNELRRVPELGFEDATTAQILALADRIDRLLVRGTPPLLQAAAVRAAVAALPEDEIAPDLRRAFLAASLADGFWLDMAELDIDRRFSAHFASFGTGTLTLEDVGDFGRLYSIIVDARSPFTATHSWGVAAVAGALGSFADLSPQRSTMLELAGQLHDIGKIAIDAALIDKPGPLTADEFAIMRSHAYYTKVLLDRIPGLEEVSVWAAAHHEQPSGNGYPYRLRGAALSPEARLLTVADKYVALTEDRPYRSAFTATQALAILEDDAAHDRADAGAVDILRGRLATVDALRRQAQEEERRNIKRVLRPAV